MLGLIIRLLSKAASQAKAEITRWLKEWAPYVVGLGMVFGEAAIETVERWIWGTPQEQQQIVEQLPPLSAAHEALFVQFQQSMDAQYQIQMLKRYMLTLPALPHEGH